MNRSAFCPGLHMSFLHMYSDPLWLTAEADTFCPVPWPICCPLCAHRSLLSTHRHPVKYAWYPRLASCSKGAVVPLFFFKFSSHSSASCFLRSWGKGLSNKHQHSGWVLWVMLWVDLLKMSHWEGMYIIYTRGDYVKSGTCRLEWK